MLARFKTRALDELHSNAEVQHGGTHCRALPGLGLADLLTEAVVCIATPSASEAKLLERLETLRERLAVSRFQLAVLGQFKRGKSMLLNALLGADVLPTGVIPVTAIPTFLQFAPGWRLRVTFGADRTEQSEVDGPSALRERLAEIVTEAANPHNRLGVTRVDVFLPSALLARGVVLVDTPGVGSTFRHNTAAADAVLPECDAALFVVSPDPPISEVEVEFLARVRKTVARLIIVLNKIDTLESEDRVTAAAFLRRVLSEQQCAEPAVPIFCLSGRAGLRARLAGNAHAVTASGLLELEAHLVQFLTHEKLATLRVAVARKAAALLGELKLEKEFHLKALSLPLEDLERRMAAFDDASARFEAERRTAADLLAGDRIRLLHELEADAERLRTEARALLLTELDKALARRAAADEVRAALGGTIIQFFDTELAQIREQVGKRLAAMLQTHQRRADDLIAFVQRIAADLLEVPFQASASSEALDTHHDPFWVTRPSPEVLDAIPSAALDQFLPKGMRHERFRRRLIEEIEGVLLRNVENLRWATRQNVEDTFRRFRAELDERLALSLVATRGAMVAARDARKQQSASIGPEIESARVALSRLGDIREALARM
jgi:Dynamin family